MGVLKELTKEYFGETKREEDKLVFNTQDLDFIDMGGSVLWADKDLKIVGDLHDLPSKFTFSYKTICDIDFGDGMRLPTVKEICELENVENKLKNMSRVVFMTNSVNGLATLYFYSTNYDDKDYCYRLTSDVDTKKGYVKCVDLYKTPFNVIDADVDGQYYEVRLVKDK